MTETIYDLFRKVKEHPDFVFGTIFTVDDFEERDDAIAFKNIEGIRPEDRLAERGHEYISDVMGY